MCIRDRLTAASAGLTAAKLIEEVIDKTGLIEEYMKEGEIEGQTRIENMEELISVAVELEEKEGISELNDFLAYTSLITDTDVSDENSDCVVLMTMHAAKGLEFPVVFVTGLEEGLFPKVDPYTDNEEELEEERRLCYVAITRAKEKLFLSCARQRTMYGHFTYNKPSRFLAELPSELLTGLKAAPAKPFLPKPAQPAQKSYDFSAAAKGLRKTAPLAGGKAAQVQIGDRVSHKKFGEGTVADNSSSVSMTILSIDFDSFGRKSIVSTAVQKVK